MKSLNKNSEIFANKCCNIIVDGSNIAYHRKSRKGSPKFFNIKLSIRFLTELKNQFPIKFEIIVDASLRHDIDQFKALEDSINEGKIVQCPKGMKADDFMLDFLKKNSKNTLVITNDNFDDYEIDDSLKDSILKFVIMNNQVVIPELEDKIANILEKIREAEICAIH